MYKSLFSMVLVLSAAALASPVSAQASCTTRDHLTDRLDDSYAERMSAVGLSGPNRMFELRSSDETGTWTLFIATPDGRSCVIASGSNWSTIPAMMLPMGELG